MKVSYEGIGQWAATFACGQVSEGEMVKVSASGEVSACSDGDSFCGVVVFVARDGEADGSGGVKASSAGRSYLVVDVDTSGKTVTFAL